MVGRQPHNACGLLHATHKSRLICKYSLIHVVWKYRKSINRISYPLQALVAGLTYYNVKFGVRTSGLTFLFWFLLTLLSIPRCRTEVRLKNARVDNGISDSWADYKFVSFMISFAASCALVILWCFGDQKPRDMKYESTEVGDVCLIIIKELVAGYEKCLWIFMWEGSLLLSNLKAVNLELVRILGFFSYIKQQNPVAAEDPSSDLRLSRCAIWEFSENIFEGNCFRSHQERLLFQNWISALSRANRKRYRQLT